MEHLIIEETTVYEIDEECQEEKKEQEGRQAELADSVVKKKGFDAK